MTPLPPSTNPIDPDALDPEAAPPPASEIADELGSLSLYAAAELPPHPAPRLVPRAPQPSAGAGALPPLTTIERFNTTRLLPAKYSESVLTRVADTDEDLQLLFELESATNDRLLAESDLRLGMPARELVFGVPHARIINAAFTHPHPQGGRFSLPFRGSWYAAFELATAKAEVHFHRALQFSEIGWNQPEELDYDQYLADFSGSFHDLRPPEPATTEPSPGTRPRHRRPPAPVTALELRAAADPLALCMDPKSYVHSQRLTLELLEQGSHGVLYPSTRRRGGECIACFRPALVGNVRKRDRYRLTWYPDRAAQWLRMPPPA